MIENVISGLITAGIIAAVTVLYRWLRFGSLSTTVVFAPNPDGKFNKAFYKHFCRQIARAKEDIIITGEGFEYSDSVGEEIAQQFEKSTRVALEKGVRIKRFQSTSNTHPQWSKHLRELLVDFPDQFHLYLVEEKQYAQVASFCVIDSDTRRSVSEFMITRKRDFGGISSNLAATAVFVHGKSQFANILRQKIIDLENQSGVHHCEQPTDLDAYLQSSQPLYFSYGSNMDKNQMLERCPTAVYKGVGLLPRHRLVFNRKGTYRDGSVASVESNIDDDKSKVYGVVWEMTAKDLIEMDKIEDPLAYERVKTVIQCQGSPLLCNMYVSIPESDPPPPDKEYVRLIVDAAKLAELPSGYIQSIRDTLESD